MKRFLEELKGARKIEWFLVLLALAVLLLTQLGDGLSETPHLTEQEKRISAILARIEGAGKVEAMISDRGESGILIVAEGADNLLVNLRLQHAVQALLGVEAVRIEIMPYRD